MLAATAGVPTISESTDAIIVQKELTKFVRCIYQGNKLTMDDEASVDSVEGMIDNKQETVADKTVVFKVTYGENILDVTQAGKLHLEAAMLACANQPTYFLKCNFVMESCADILKIDVLDFAFPEPGDDDTVADFSWANTVAGRRETYPPPSEPTKDQFGLIKLVYEEIKAEKDDLAKQQNRVSSGIQAYKTFKAKLCAFRKWSAIYNELYIKMEKKTRMDAMMAELKLCTSEKHIWTVIDKAVAKHINKLKSDARKKREQERLDALKLELEAKKVAAEKAAADAKKKVGSISSRKASVQDRNTRSGNVAALRRLTDEERLGHKQEKVAVKEIKKVEKEIKQLSKRKNVLEKANEKASKPTKKKQKRTAARNDIGLLNEAPTPRKLLELDGETMRPPTRTNATTFGEPGETWKTNSIKKVRLISSLYRYLTEANAVDPLPTFKVVMETIAAGEKEGYNFFDRAFIYLLALVLFEHFECIYVIEILLSLRSSNLLKRDTLATVEAATLNPLIKGSAEFDVGDIGDNIKTIASNVHALAAFPTTLDEIIGCGVKETTARLLMQEVFCSTEMVIGLNTRKLVVALDLIDWEGETTTGRRSDVKSSKISEACVRNSLSTWIPPGEGQSFAEAAEKVGEFIGENKIGSRGILDATAKKHFKPADKDQLIKMADSIVQYYKATKCGAAKQFNF